MVVEAGTGRERPILFKGPMVREVDAGRKTETRRVVADSEHLRWVGWPCDGDTGWTHPPRCSAPRPNEVHVHYVDGFGWENLRCPYGVPGDRLWVRETWASKSAVPHERVAYRADGVWGALGGDGDGNHRFYRHGWVLGEAPPDRAGRWLALPTFGGRWRPSIHMPRWASRLTLAVESVRVERLHDIDDAGARREGVADREAFRALWCNINGARSWDVNPWVWVVEFEVVRG